VTYLSDSIIEWYEKYGRKKLPWKSIEPNPFHIWVSEIMLQQTQVATVVPYFQKFIARFPNIHTLAIAKEDEVMSLWSGLGYYARARNLHKTSKIIEKQFNGLFPTSFHDLISLPGIGRSTAGAIMSLAYNQSYAILDGNVKRVLARFHQVSRPGSETKYESSLWDLANKHLPNKENDKYTQAIMDLGATICKRSKPDCEICPLKTKCQSFLFNTQDEYPMPAKKISIRKMNKTFIVFRNREKIYLEKRKMNDIWGGLWSFMETEDKKNIHTIIKNFDRNSKIVKKLEPFIHKLSHREIKINAVIVETSKNTDNFFALNEINFGLPKPVAQIIEHLKLKR